MENSFPKAALTLVAMGLAVAAFSDPVFARGGGGSHGGGSHGSGSRGGSFSRSAGRPSFSNFRSISKSSNNNRAFHPTTSKSFSAFSKTNLSTSPKNTFSRPTNLNKGTGSANKSGKQMFTKNSKNGKNAKNANKHHYPWERYWGGYGGYDGGYDDGDDCGDGSCDSGDDGSPAYGDAMPGDMASDPSALPAGQLVIVNPAETQATLAYTINGQSYSLNAGETQPLNVTTSVTIEFDRGLSGDLARYSLTAGTYTFQSTDKGWDLASGSPSATPTLAPVLNAPQSGLAAGGPQY
jgi:hypothetical protein